VAKIATLAGDALIELAFLKTTVKLESFLYRTSPHCYPLKFPIKLKVGTCESLNLLLDLNT
jgi:hypothetical protein